MHLTGETEVSIRGVQVNGQPSVDDAAKEHLVKSPSVAANRMLQVILPGFLPHFWLHQSEKAVLC